MARASSSGWSRIVFRACISVAVLAPLARIGAYAFEAWYGPGPVARIVHEVTMASSLFALVAGFAVTLGALWRTQATGDPGWDRAITAGKWCAASGALCLVTFALLPSASLWVP